MVSRENKGFPPACERTIEILEYISTDENGHSAKEISEALSIPIASLYRILNCLEYYGLIRPNRVNNELLKLGHKIGIWASSASDMNELIEVARPFMKEIANRTGQACQICVLSSDSAVVVAQELPVKAIAVISELGEKIAINASAGGQVLLSNYSEERQIRFLHSAARFIKVSGGCQITDEKGYIEKLSLIREQGYAIDDEAYALGIGCLSVPIVLSDGTKIAAIGITGQIEFYHNADNINHSVSLLKKVASDVSKSLG